MLFLLITLLIFTGVIAQYGIGGGIGGMNYNPINTPLYGTQKLGMELYDKVYNTYDIKPTATYEFKGSVSGWVEQKPIGKESVYSRPLDMPGGELLYKTFDKAKHTAYVTESNFGTFATEKSTTGLSQTENFDKTGWKLEKERPIYSTEKFTTTGTDKYNVFKSNCQDYTDKVFGK